MEQRKKIYLVIINIFIISAIIALVGTAYLTLVTATVIIPGERTEFKSSASLTVTKEGGEGDVLMGSIVSRSYEASDIFAVDPSLTQAAKAGGMVTIVNESSRNQTLVATTRLLTADGKLFRITQRVNVPAGKRIDVFAEADQEGNQFVVPENTRFTIPGLTEPLRTVIYAISKTSLSLDRATPTAVSEDDIARAEEALFERIISKALEDLTAELPEGFSLSKDLLTSKRTALIADPHAGTPATETKVTLRVDISALLVSPEEIRRAAEAKLMRELPDPQTFIEMIPSSFTYSVGAIDTEKQEAQLTASIAAWIQASGSVQNLDHKQLTGKTKAEAYRYLTAQGVQGARIEIFPSWLPTLPFLQDHIYLEVQ